MTGQPIAAQQASATPQQSSTTQQQPSTTKPAAPAPAVAAPFYAGDGFSITLQYWLGFGHPDMSAGHQNTSGISNALDYEGKPNPIPGAVLSIPVGKHNAVRVSYFHVQGNGNSTAPTALEIFGTNYNQGDYLAVHYTLQNAKVSLDYLSWPFPVKDSKFHIKTLWEVQYTTVATGTDAPLRHGQTDASGNPINVSASGTDSFFYPSFGLGADYLISQRLRFEARASGFAFPHRSTIWDTEATLNYRFGRFEIQGGAKAFHFKTSPERTEYVHATLPGVFVGLRWYPEYGRR
ncbi:MAG TPA: hypothetical protein VMT86_04490 [Bryobacteraceae bacterium]|nr:hypothetical protein [Bryobacteraceae bacterium]